VFPNSQQTLIEEGRDAEVLYGSCREETFAALSNLKWIQSSSAGMDKQLYDAIKDSDVIVTNAAGLYATHVADQAFALLLGLARNIDQFTRSQDKHEWGRGRRPLIEIGGFTICIVGMGGIGRQMAQRAKGFGMYVVSVDPYLKGAPDTVDELLPMDRLADAMSRADVVMIACPLTAETRHLISAENLAVMKPTAYFINVARGPIHNEPDLIEVMKAGKIAGAGLDVTEVEPLSKESPLWDIENVIITPHVAGGSQHRLRRITEFFCENLKRYVNGESLQNVVNKDLGF
jgi:D-3-phosphoglycerate dehydrogenase